MVGNGKLRKWKLPSLRSKPSRKDPPTEFVCPISGQLMFDPVVVSSGQTFERTAVLVCRDLKFVPTLSDGSRPDFSNVITNLALKTTITNWSSSVGKGVQQSVPDYGSIEAVVRELMPKSDARIESGDVLRVSERNLIDGVTEKPEVIFSHAETELNRRSHVNDFYSSSSEESVIANVVSTPMLPFTTRPLCYSSCSSTSPSSEIVSEENLNYSSEEQEFVTKLKSQEIFTQEQGVILLRKVTRTNEEARVSLCTVRLLAVLKSCLISRYAAVQTNAVAALVNLSLEKVNKVKIVRSGMVPPLIDVLKAGFPDSQEHAAGVIFSLALDDDNKTAIGVLGALQPLLHALRSESVRTRNDSAMALYHLSFVQSNRVKLVKLGAVSTLLAVLKTDLVARVLLVLCNMAASTEGKSAMLDSNAVECLVGMLRKGSASLSESSRENCVACLYSLSTGSMRFKGLAREARAAEVLSEVEENGSERAREKAKRMLAMLRDRDEEAEAEVDWEEFIERGLSRTRHRFGMNVNGVNSNEF